MFKQALNEIMENLGTIIIWGLIIVAVLWPLIRGLSETVGDYFSNINLFNVSSIIVNSGVMNLIKMVV